MSECWTNVTTSRRQGQVREGLSEGSSSAKVRADEQTRTQLGRMLTGPRGQGGEG